MHLNDTQATSIGLLKQRHHEVRWPNDRNRCALDTGGMRNEADRLREQTVAAGAGAAPAQDNGGGFVAIAWK